MQNADDSHEFFGIALKVGKEIIEIIISAVFSDGVERLIKYVSKKVRKIFAKEHKNDILVVEAYDTQTGDLIYTIIIRKLKDDGFRFTIIDVKTGNIYNEQI